MSSFSRPIPDIPFADLFDGRLEKYGVREERFPDTTRGRRYLVGAEGALTVYREKDGTCSLLKQETFMRVPWAVYDAIIKEFNVKLVGENDHRYWGFATKKEWDAFNAKMAKEADDDLYADILNYVTGKPHGFGRGTVGMAKAKIAKTLVKRDPNLLAPIKRNTLLKAVNGIYDRNHAIIVTLTKRDLALARTRSTWPARYRKASRHLRRRAVR